MKKTRFNLWSKIKVFLLFSLLGFNNSYAEGDPLGDFYGTISVRASVRADLGKGMEAYKTGDYATALREWTPLAKQGNSNAQLFLAHLYYKGKGVLQDYKTGLKWITAAAERGNVKAQLELAGAYRTGAGTGVPKDYKAAVKWYKAAAKQGDAKAQNKLGQMYGIGQGVPQDYKAEFKWYKTAAEQGDATGQGNLGYMYDWGKGVPQDNVYAHMWYNISESHGGYVFNRDRVAERMTPSQIEKAQALARECVRKNYKGC